MVLIRSRSAPPANLESEHNAGWFGGKRAKVDRFAFRRTDAEDLDNITNFQPHRVGETARFNGRDDGFSGSVANGCGLPEAAAVSQSASFQSRAV